MSVDKNKKHVPDLQPPVANATAEVQESGNITDAPNTYFPPGRVVTPTVSISQIPTPPKILALPLTNT